VFSPGVCSRDRIVARREYRGRRKEEVILLKGETEGFFLEGRLALRFRGKRLRLTGEFEGHKNDTPFSKIKAGSDKERGGNQGFLP